MNYDIFRGEVWLLDLNPTMGREQAGTRPALVISVDNFNNGPAELAIVIPITSKERHVRSHVKIPAGEGGLTMDSFAKCEDVRSVSRKRFIRRFGAVPRARLAEIEEVLRILMDL